jgi:protease I
MLISKKIVMIIASNNFRDEEYNEPRLILEKNGANITVASTTLNEAKGMLGLKVKPDILLDNVNVDDYDAIVFVGGSGATEYWDNLKAYEIAKDAYNKKKVLAAICIAPITLAKAGLLIGKNATVYSSEVENIKKLGANYTGKPVEVDGLIITASGPASAKEFGEKIVDLLK